eukprot:CAMPEP_0178932658 /NCGR_PEP_ID=MMETSP0786-20121207/22760_1 /TAXON_ID=186022 /ORGANISM="Thalassionema frauenfeldii, Strain CCMP 1798" /LENGTH=138 /DNA_ID=CAMNT_0020610015 /DNA_START=112 /DNA_END=525 /DNA_ORIENTATION=+
MASNQSALEDPVASILTIAENTIMPAIIEEYFSDFLSSADYIAFTKAPEGNKAYKNLKGKVHKARGILKESHQKFSFEHLPNDDGRRKYGKKMQEKTTCLKVPMPPFCKVNKFPMYWRQPKNGNGKCRIEVSVAREGS